MLRIALFLTISLAAIFSSVSSAHTVLVQGIHFSINFNPQEKKVLENPLWWSSSAHCEFNMDNHANALINIELLSHSASIDGQSLIPHQCMRKTIANHQNMYIKAAASAKVEITNKNTYALHASCS